MTRNPRNVETAQQIGRPLRRASQKARVPVDLCPDSLFCYELTNEFDLNSLRLDTISLYVVDPQDPDTDRIDLTYGPPFEPAADAAAMAALRQAARNSTVVFGCSEGCECRIPDGARPRTGRFRVPIFGGFSLPAPNPPPPRLRYRANGMIGLKVSVRLGLCVRVEV